jgi:arylsulfatase A-like enzyme
VLHGWTQYQEMLHVPLIFVGPGMPRGLRIDQAVSLVDLAPTALSLLGVTAIPASAGRNLAALWQDPAAAWPERSLFAEANLIVEPAGPKRAVVRGHWKLVLDPRKGERELYDLDADPLERVNRATAEPEQATILANDLSLALGKDRAAPVLPRLTHAERAQLQALGYVRE